MEKPIRVLVANRPRLMRDTILTTFADQPDIEIVGEVADESQIFESVKKTLPDFVVVALDRPGERPRICDILLHEHPEVRVIAVAQSNNYVVYYWASLDIHLYYVCNASTLLDLRTILRTARVVLFRQGSR